MHVEYAQLPDPEHSADRVFVTDHAVIVLDGATAFVPTSVSASHYADHLGRSLADALTCDPTSDLRTTLADSIAATSEALNLDSDSAPSSTVAILREGSTHHNLVVLGDTAILWGDGISCHRLVDNRLDDLPLAERDAYQQRLKDGHGYDEHHRQMLANLQNGQRAHRNRQGGYWIASTQPEAARHALTRSIPRDELLWAVLATDGVTDPLDHLTLERWPSIANYSSAGLTKLLGHLRKWESEEDSEGTQLPRAKVSDDKAVAVVDLRATPA